MSGEAISPTAELVGHALAYATRGWRVVPLHTPTPDAVRGGVARPCSCNRLDCSSVGKHPRLQWRAAATTDEEQIRKWWATWPEANIGIATGGGLLVIDVDGEEGLASLLDLERRLGLLPSGPRVRTGSGGLHVFLASSDDVSNSVKSVAPGIDVRSEGGLVVAPPSLHASGKRYEWIAIS